MNSKAVLISIKPDWVGLIASGQKTIEVRKTRPKMNTPFKCYIYCTMDGDKNGYQFFVPYKDKNVGICTGRVVGEFVCDRIDVIEISSEAHKRFAKESCLTQDDFIEYCNGQDLYGWHISDLVIYDEPKELSEFKGRKLVWRGNNHIHDYEDIKRPPQSWCYVKGEVKENEKEN